MESAGVEVEKGFGIKERYINVIVHICGESVDEGSMVVATNQSND